MQKDKSHRKAPSFMAALPGWGSLPSWGDAPVDFTLYVGRRLMRDNVPGVAASLGYTSLLALVPLMAVGLAILAAFPAFDEAVGAFQDFIFENFVPAAGEVVQENLQRFIGATGQLTAVGVAGLAVTAVLMLTTLERAMNTIFRVSQGRPVVARVMMYWTVLTLGPLLIGASFTLSSTLAARALAYGGEDVRGLWGHVSALMPSLLTFLAFTLTYMIVPNRRVRLRDAALGGLAATLLFAALRHGFLVFVAGVPTYQTIYGALATLPVFLIWMYLSWIAFLAGAVMTASLPEWRMKRGHGASGGSKAAQLSLCLDTLAALAAQGRKGRGLDRNALLARTGAEEPALLAVLDPLFRNGFVVRTESGGWALVRPLDQTTLGDVIDALDLGLPTLSPSPDGSGRFWITAATPPLTTARKAEAAPLTIPLTKILSPPPRKPKEIPLETEG